MNLESNETVLRQERLHPGIFAIPALAVLLFLIPDAGLYFLILQLHKSFGSQPMTLFGIALILLSLLPGLALLVVVWLA